MKLADFLHNYSIVLIVIYVFAICLFSFALMGIDKKRAVLGWRRLPERTLLALGLLGGSAGILLGMTYYKHKVNPKRHPAFAKLMPVVFFIQLVLVIAYCIYYFVA